MAEFYDYLEIQPIENNRFLISDQRDGKYIENDEDLWRLNERILTLGKQAGKSVVATGDLHFIDPEDECYRRILMAGQGFESMDAQPPLFFHTTDEMLAAFSRLGEDVAHQIVVEAPIRIANMIEDTFAPFPAGTCLPHEEGGGDLVMDIAKRGYHGFVRRSLTAPDRPPS